MNIAMFTNLYLPLVGGIQKSIATFKREFEERGHRVLVVTPELEDKPLDDPTVVQVPAIQNYNGSDFAVALPIPGYLANTLDEFQPDIIHAHHPFLLGDTALRAATKRNRSLVFTYHTMWEHYLHYAPSDSPAMQEFVKRMAAEYCNLCDQIIAPCESIADILRERGVMTPIEAVPTGIDTERFRAGDRNAARQRWGVPEEVRLVGYIGRLGPEKNLGFVARALIELCQQRDDVHAVLVGDGEMTSELEHMFADASLPARLYMPGTLEGQALVDAYHALDVFTFASHSETQGLVLAEAMAAGRPVVALDAPGARDIVQDGENGRILAQEERSAFVDAIVDVIDQPPAETQQMQQAAVATGEAYSSGNCAEQVLELYQTVVNRAAKQRPMEDNPWLSALRRLEAEWSLWSGRAAAAGRAMSKETQDDDG